MYSELNLLALLVAPVIAYLTAALIFGFIEVEKNDQALPDSPNPSRYRNGHQQ